MRGQVIGTQRDKERRQSHRRWVTIVVVLILLLGLLLWLFWRYATNASDQEQSMKNAMTSLNKDKVSQGWVVDYVQKHSLSDADITGNNEKLNAWLKNEVGELMKSEVTTPTQSTVFLTNVAPSVTTNYQAGTGMVMNGMRIDSMLGDSIEGGEIASHTVGLGNLATNGCVSGEVIKFNGIDWTCGIDNSAQLSETGGVTNRLTIFSSTSTLTSSYLAQDANGLWIDSGKNLYIGGIAYGDGSGLFDLNGSQLKVGSVGGNALQASSITNAALSDSAVSTSKLADESITNNKIASSGLYLNRLNQSGCSTGQSIKWNGLSWACATDIDSDTTYSAGSGMRLDGQTLSLDSAASNNWTATQSFGGGISVGGTTYLALEGNGLTVNSGVLNTTLGDSIESSELGDGAVISTKLANGAVTLSKLGQSGCSVNQIIKWNGSEWICNDDADTNYTAGSGLVLSGNSISLDTTSSNTWSGLQTFSDGLKVNGNVYTNLAGSGLAFNAGVLSTTIGDSVGTADLEEGAVTSSKLAAGSLSFDRLAQNGCTSSQVIKWNGTGWVCADDNDQDTVYGAGDGLKLAAGNFSVDTSQSNIWIGLQAFNGGLRINGNTYTDLVGTGLVFNNGALQTTLGTNIDSAELNDSAVTNSKIADGTIGFSKLGQNGCTLDQVLKWNGTGWACSDVDTTTGGSNTNAPYSAGAGLALTQNTFSLDSAHANTWLASQVFSGGLQVGGSSYSNLAGDGLIVSGGTLNTVLGSTIEASEISNGAITSAKLAPGVVTLDKLAQNGCSTGQIISWNGAAWECINVVDTDTTYSAGAGLLQSGSAFQLDTSASNEWTGLQAFDNGIKVGSSTLTNLAGSGLTVSGGVLQTTMGASVDTDEITNAAITNIKVANNAINTNNLIDGSVTTSKLGQNGCSNGNVLKWQSTTWVCAIDVDSDTDTTYTAGSGLSLSGGAFSLDTTSANTWAATQVFGNGVTIAGNTYTNLAGNGLALTAGALTTTLGTSIEENEIASGAVTASKIASGAITLDKLASSSCTTQQTIKWSGSAWACANDVDTNTTYGAGRGIQLNASNFSLDTSLTNTWTAEQTFSGGLVLGGLSYSNLVGTGLSYSNGVLNSSLGISIETNEISDGAITLSKIGQSGCTTSQVLKWSGSAWVCSDDVDTKYTAGMGITLSSNSFNLDLSRSNNWSGLQVFTNGFGVGGNTYTNLAGSGLSYGSGTLSSTLGTSIETSEITDGAITSTKILDGTVISADLSDGAVTSAKILDGTINGVDIASGTITASNIADGTLTMAKLSSNARKRVVTANITVPASLLSVQEQAIFVAPTNGTITKVSFTSSNNFVAVSTGGTISVERKTATTGTVASLNLASVGMTALSPTAPTLGSGLTFNTGDLYTFKYAPGVVGLNLNNLLVSVEYTAND
jgi:trimeric autotransporter adhesin